MIIETSINKILVIFQKRYSYAEVKEAAKIKADGYADQFVDRLYSAIFKNPRDVIAEYDKYYSLEYRNLQSFLFWKHGLDKDVVGKITDIVKDGGYIGYGRDILGIYYLLMDDTFVLVFTKLTWIADAHNFRKYV